MTIHPTPEAFAALARLGNCIPLYADFLADFETPVSAYAKLRGHGPAYLLESVEGGARVARYSFVGYDPRALLQVFHDRVVTTDRLGQQTVEPRVGDALAVLQRAMAGVQPVSLPGLPPFVGGAVGMLGYEFIHQVEPTVPLARHDPHSLPVATFLLSDTLLVFDRARQTLRLLVNVHLAPSEAPATAYARGTSQLQALAARLAQPTTLPPAPFEPAGKVELPPSNTPRAELEAMVERAQEYIRAGDIFQLVGSHRFDRPFAAAPLDLYRALRTVNPSPYMFLIEFADFALVGASPEVHVRLTQGKAEIRPIAGTRPRGTTAELDTALERELLADEKERAEHLMLVDLARNDLGRVCAYGSVTVPEFMIVERYSHVMHIVSQVEGQLAAGRDAFDLMRATFPAGTVSGAPKVRAMQIIAEFERDQRGPYAGAVAYFGYDGNLDSAIAIRTALVRDGKLSVQAGGGWVADSVPATEYQETVNKASAMLRAAALAEQLHPA